MFTKWRNLLYSSTATSRAQASRVYNMQLLIFFIFRTVKYPLGLMHLNKASMSIKWRHFLFNDGNLRDWQKRWFDFFRISQMTESKKRHQDNNWPIRNVTPLSFCVLKQTSETIVSFCKYLFKKHRLFFLKQNFISYPNLDIFTIWGFLILGNFDPKDFKASNIEIIHSF